MKSIRKTTGMLLAFLLAGILLPVTVKAEGNITLSADVETAVVGDTVTVTYQAEDASDSAEAPQIEITYDPNRLSLTGCDKEYGGGEGGLLQFTDTSATITFSVLSGGTAEVDATAILGGDGAEPATAFVTIAVDGEDTAAALSAAATSSTGIEPGTIVSSDGTKIVSTVFADDYMPALFHKEAGSYQGQPVEVAKFDMGDITLVYVTDTTGANGNFNILDPMSGELSDYKMIQGIENRYIIILRAPADVQTPNGFTKAELQWDGLNLEAYAVNAIDSTIISDVPASDFFLLYAISSEGYKGWYLYDQIGGTYQRYLPVADGNIQSDEEESGGFLSALTGGGADEGEYQTIAFRRLIIIGIMAIVMIVMFIFLLNFFLKLRDYQSYDYVDEEDEDDIRTQPVRREPSVEETSRIRASELARMEMGETFEPVNFDKLVNDPFEKKPATQTPKSVTTPEAAAAKLSQAEAAAKEAPVKPAAPVAKPAAVSEPAAVKPEPVAKPTVAEVKPATPAPAAAKPASAPAPSATPEVKPVAPAPAAAKPVSAPEPSAMPEAKPAAPGKIASVEDYVKPAAPSTEFTDDYDDEEEGGLFSRKKKDKKKSKNMGFDEPEEMDWSSLEGPMKTEDERRPKGGESPYVKKFGSPDVTPSAVEPPKVETPKVELPTNVPKPGSDKTVKPVSQTYKETVPQQESGYWQQSTAGQYQEPQYEQSQYSQSYDPYAQPQYNQSYAQPQYNQGYDPYAQPQYNQGYAQSYDPYAQPQYNQGYNQSYDPYAQPQYNQGYNQGYGAYGQNPYNTQSMDFDDDFEFEFIDINR